MAEPLDILNSCMRAVGERPVTDYLSLHPTAISARQTIEDTDKEFQTRGWWFNKEYDLLLSATLAGEVILPANTLEVRALDSYSHLVQRNGKFYDPVNHTYIIDANVRVQITIQLPIADIPASAFNYLKNLARYNFSVDESVDEAKIQRFDRAVLLSKVVMNNDEFRVLDTNSQLRPVSMYLMQHLQQHGGVQGDATYIGGGD